MTAAEKELLYDLAMAVISLLDDKTGRDWMTRAERARMIASRLEAMHDDDMRRQRAEDVSAGG